jgi:drug/metabolite transporter (DMT)-like permease
LEASLAVAQRRRFLTGIAFGALGSVLFSGKAIIIKLAYRHGVDAVTLIALRMLVALPFFAVVAYLQSQRSAQVSADASGSSHASASGISNPGPWQHGDVWRILGLGLIGYYAASFFDFIGLQYISAALERVILYLNPTLVLLISMVMLGKRPSRRELIALAVAYAGMLVVFAHDLATVPLARGEGGATAVVIGTFWVLASALAYAIYLVASGQMVARVGSLRLTAWASIVACAACITQALVVNPHALLEQAAEVYWLSLVNGIACTVLPVFLVMMAIERLGSTVASQTGMVGPVATIALAAVLLDEPIGLSQLAGTAIVLTAVWIVSARRR